MDRRAALFHSVLIDLYFSMSVQHKIRQKLNTVSKTKGH